MRNNLDYIPSWLDGATTLLQKLNKCIARVEELAHSDITEVNARLDVIQPKVNELVEDVDGLEADVETLKEYIQPDVSELEAEVENIKAEIGTLATEIDGVQGTLESVGEDVEALENNVENINTNLLKKAGYVSKITSMENPTNYVIIGRETDLIIVQVLTGGVLSFKRKETQQSTFEITKTYNISENENFFITQRGMDFTVFRASNGNYEHLSPDPFSYDDYERRLELTCNYGAIIKVGD